LRGARDLGYLLRELGQPVRETTIVLADDHGIVREALRRLIESRSDLRVVAQASSGEEAVEAVRRHRPDVAVVDIWMPGMQGSEATRQIVRSELGTRVVILTMHEGWTWVREALRAGASGYVVKSAAAGQLLEAIDTVRAGGFYVSPAVSGHMVRAARGETPGERGPLDALTDREREILQLVAEGFSTKEIAARLALSVKTAEAHRANLMSKLGIRKASRLVRFAIREGLIAP
jgi:DNA-binding NarL/FixJ family response regulator